jgi:transcription elongation factor Elf1
MKCEKKSFSTKEAAQRRIAEIHKEISYTNKKPIRSYDCPKCGKIHLTSVTKKQQQKIVAKTKNSKFVSKRQETQKEADYWIRKKRWKE